METIAKLLIHAHSHVHAHTCGDIDTDSYQHDHWYVSPHTHYDPITRRLDRSIGPNGTPDIATDGQRLWQP